MDVSFWKGSIENGKEINKTPKENIQMNDKIQTKKQGVDQPNET